MRRVFGQFTKDKPEGALRPVHFPQMALLDQKTGDDREIASSGAGVRELPRTIFAQFAQAGGHDGSVPIGTLQEVAFEEDGTVTGRGWLADMAHVRDVFVPLIASKTLFHNSVDLAEVTVKIVWKSDDPADGEDFWTIDKILFTKANIAATTLVGVPAFADARIVLDEVTAALCDADTELEVLCDMGQLELRIEGHTFAEITAALAPSAVDVSFDDFHMPEPDVATPITVDENGRIYGHLAEWGKCHEGLNGCVLAPRPSSYASFNARNVLTDRGMVRTGPIFFLGGHPDHPLGARTADQAYGGIENSWGDVRVVDGRFGPWMSGRVRPGQSDEAVYVARASSVSGHWKAGNLIAIVSVNVPAYSVIPGTEIAASGGASFDENGEVLDLVASLRVPTPPEGEDQMKRRERLVADAVRRLEGGTVRFNETGGTLLAPQISGDPLALGRITQVAVIDKATDVPAEVVTSIDDDIMRAAIELELDEADEVAIGDQ